MIVTNWKNILGVLILTISFKSGVLCLPLEATESGGRSLGSLDSDEGELVTQVSSNLKKRLARFIFDNTDDQSAYSSGNLLNIGLDNRAIIEVRKNLKQILQNLDKKCNIVVSIKSLLFQKFFRCKKLRIFFQSLDFLTRN